MYFFFYVPVGTDAGTHRFPVMTVFFATLCTAVFAMVRFFPDSTPLDFYNFIYYPGQSGWGAAVASAFLHFGWMHLIGNMVYLLLFGAALEDRLGSAGFTLLFLGAAVVGNVSQGVWNGMVLHRQLGIIGASGAISGILGAFLVRLYRVRVRIAWWVYAPLLAYTKAGHTDVPVIFALVLWVLMQIVRGLVQLQSGSAGVAHVTHISGFLFGILFVALTGGIRRGREESYRVTARRALRRGDFLGARDALSHYVEARPNDTGGLVDLARSCVQTGDMSAAQRFYRDAIERLLDAGCRGEAESYFEEALRGFPAFALPAERMLDLAFGLERNLKSQSAVKAYEAFATRYPDHVEAPFALLRAANLHVATFADPGRARRCYERLVHAYPADAWVDFAREQMRVLT